jgi:YidC/Oxa1 family membrane protein insertase
MGMDRNTVIGFVLLAILLFLYLFISTKNSQELARQKKIYEDSVAMVAAQKNAAVPSKDTAVTPAVAKDTTGFNNPLYNAPKLVTVETDLLKIVFSTKGGQPQSVELKDYKSYDSTAVRLLSARDIISYPINTNPNQSAQIANLNFDAGEVVRNADGSQSVAFQLQGSNGERLTHLFTLRDGDYRVDWDVQVNGADKLFSQGNLNLQWQAHPIKHQKDHTYERQLSNICFSEGNSFDYISSKTEKRFTEPVQWVSVAQQFFNTTLIAKNSFNSGQVKWARNTTDTSSGVLADVQTDLQAKFPAGASSSLSFQFYYGPNDYKILKTKAAPEMDRIVNLGRDMYSFVRPINVYIIMPVFNFLKSLTGNYGIVILLLTVFIRLLTSPLMYPGYKTSAQMKILKPDLAKLKEKYPDQQQFAMEQMKFMREAGVNQFAGCLPGLLQIPIFFALYSFFNANIALRGKNFLWSDDLSAYDSILNLGFHIPLYGDHVSLFTLLAVITSFLISLYSMAGATADQSNPALKYMPYIFPIFLLGIFNSLPSALTWYYTVSNVITLLLQFVIQKYIINHDKILTKMEEARKKPKVKSKWQERLEQVQKAQEVAKQRKN